MFVIFGAGQVGLQAFRYLHTKGTCILIDRNPLEWNHPSIQTIIELQQIPFTRIQTELEFDHWERIPPFTGNHFFIQGDISVLYALLGMAIPQYLIPAAPIHVLGELCKYAILQNWPKISFLPLSISNSQDIQLNPPPELNVHHTSDHKMYLSYAKEFEICADNCFGPRGYCAHFNRVKSVTVSDFISQIFPPQSHLFHFISTQITAGLGGIHRKDLKIYTIFLSKFLKNPKLNEIFAIATTCNCHGIVERYRVCSDVKL